MPTLLDRLGLDPPDPTPADFSERLAASTRAASRGAPPPSELPRSLADTLVASAAWAAASARPDAAAHHQTTLATCLDVLPRVRVELLERDDPFLRRLFHAPLVPKLQRLNDALDRLDALAPAQARPRPETLSAYLDDTHYGRVFPPFLGMPHDLEALRAEGEALHVIDHRMAGPLTHERLHFGRPREALFPPLLDEAIVAWLGWRLDPDYVFPPPGADSNAAGFGGYVQLGALLAHLFGAQALLEAHVGARAWDEVLPPSLLIALARQALELHERDPRPMLTQDTSRPDRILKVATAAAAGEDVSAWDVGLTDALDLRELPLPEPTDDGAELLACARGAARMQPFTVGHSQRVRGLAEVPLELDLDACLARWKGGVHVLPPAWCATRRRGRRSLL